MATATHHEPVRYTLRVTTTDRRKRKTRKCEYYSTTANREIAKAAAVNAHEYMHRTGSIDAIRVVSIEEIS
jgi:hypothetical protein